MQHFQSTYLSNNEDNDNNTTTNNNDNNDSSSSSSPSFSSSSHNFNKIAFAKRTTPQKSKLSMRFTISLYVISLADPRIL